MAFGPGGSTSSGSNFGSAKGAKKSEGQKQGTAAKQLQSALKRLEIGGVAGASVKGLSNLKQGYESQKFARFRNPIEDVGGTILAGLNKPSQAVLRGVQAQQTGTDVSDAVGRGWRSGTNADPQINFRQALNTDNWQAGKGFVSPEAEAAAGKQTFIDANKDVNPILRGADRFLAGAVDFGATAVTDPLSYVGLGGPKRLNAGLRAVTAAAGDDVARQVARQGAGSLDNASAAELRQKLMALPQAQNIRGGPEAFATKLLGGEGNALTRQRGSLEQAQGIKFAGQTVLPARVTEDVTAPLRAAQAAVGSTRAGQAAARVPQALGNTFQPRAQIAREVGKDVAEDIGLAASKSEAGKSERLADITRQFQAIERTLPKGVNPEDFQRTVVTPALERGDWREVAQLYRAEGRAAEADYIELTDQLRRRITDDQLDAGLLSKEWNTDTYVPHQLTPQALEALEKIPEARNEILSFKPIGPDKILQGAETKSRSFMPGASISEKNAAIAEKYGVTGAYEPNAAKALGIKAAKVYDNVAKVELVREIERLTDDAGNKVLQAIPDNAKKIRDLEVATKQQIRDIDKQIKSAQSTLHREKIANAKKIGKSDVADAMLGRLGTRINALETALAAAQSRRTVAGINSRAAAEAGTAAKATPSRTSADVKSELNAVLADPMIPEYIRTQIRKEYTTAIKSAIQEKRFVQQENAANAAKAGAKPVQRKIGATQTAAKYENILTGVIDRQLKQAQKDFDFASRRSVRQALSDDSTKDLIADLTEQRKQLRAEFREQKRSLKDAEKIEKPEGYAKLDMGPLGAAYVPDAVSRHLTELEGAFNKQGAWQDASKIAGTGTQVLKNLILNTPVAIVSRNTRDFFGNIPNMVAAGYKNPGTLVTAGKIQNAMNKAYKAGMTTEEAVSTLPPKWQKYEQMLRESGSIDAGQIRSDVTHQGLGIGESNARGAKVKRGFDVRNAEGYLTRHGSRLNTQADDLVRRAMFIDQIDQHGNAADAAKAVRRALPDYADLTPREKEIRKFMIFYTFTARNLKMQSLALRYKPQVPLNVDRLQQEMGGGDSGDAILPSYALAAGQVPLGKVAGNAVLGTIQSPYQAAATSVQPLVDIASWMLPEEYTTTRGLQGGAAELLSTNLGGTYGQAAKSGIETATGTDLRSGAPLPETRGELLKRGALQTFPRGTTYEGLIDTALKGDDTKRLVQLMRLAGISTTAVTPKTELSETYARKRAAEESAQRQGIPTLTELKRTGKAKSTK